MAATAAWYDPGEYPPVFVAVDVVIFTIVDDELRVLLIERGEDPYAGSLALPGGFVRPDEDLSEAAARELREETGVRAAKHLAQLGAYGRPDRDPRARIVSVAYVAVVPKLGPIRAATDARSADLFSVRGVLGPGATRRLAFDHGAILRDGLDHARAKLETTSIATAFVPGQFTMSELRRVYEIVWDTELDPGNFRRKVTATPGFVAATNQRAVPGPEGGKPPEIYRAGRRTPIRLDPPLRRPGH